MSERIVSTPGICGGDARIRFTRIPVWLVVKARRDGATDATLLDDYPFLSPLDLADAWLYYGTHIAEINQQILENEKDPKPQQGVSERDGDKTKAQGPQQSKEQNFGTG